MSGKTFVDTNVLVYAYDRSHAGKNETARSLVADLWASGLGVLSTQVLQEFFVTVTAKVPRPLKIEKAREIVRDLLRWEVVVNDAESLVGAADLQKRYGYSFWDSLIIRAAVEAGADILVTEDLAAGQTIGGVTIRNPFSGGTGG